MTNIELQKNYSTKIPHQKFVLIRREVGLLVKCNIRIWGQRLDNYWLLLSLNSIIRVGWYVMGWVSGPGEGLCGCRVCILPGGWLVGDRFVVWHVWGAFQINLAFQECKGRCMTCSGHPYLFDNNLLRQYINK